ncbi:MAG: NFACT RNA binding domain-containing protein [Spirochaetales bacterium]|nr:NFACT RNA binding domain-containing protein [Spirochaetales bacterium]
MSLNYKEIDLVLSELDIEGAKLQKVVQPSYDSLILEFYGPRGLRDVFVGLGAGSCRIHPIPSLPAKNERPLRFMECLRSHLRGATLCTLRQLGRERILKLDFSQADGQRYRLYIRLWSGAANAILADDQNRIVDVMYRKPARGEVSGMLCRVEELLEKAAADTAARAADQAVTNGQAAQDSKADRLDRFQVRELEGEGSFSEKIAALYSAKGGDLSMESLLAKVEERFQDQRIFFQTKLKEIDARIAEASQGARLRQIGDILMAGLPQKPQGTASGNDSSRFVEAQDFYTGKTISIQVDPRLDHIGNAKRYYERAKKADLSLEDLRRERQRLETARDEAQLWRDRLFAQTDPFSVAKALERGGTVREKPKKLYPCLWIEKNGWTLLVGRSAKENDELLRHHTRGSDLWLHVRDYSGSYVFIKARRDKSVPLEILLDAGTLAVYYSKARKNSEANVYYTQVKHLRRIKGETKGLVSPSMEKNLFIRLDEKRLREILSISTGGT